MLRCGIFQSITDPKKNIYIWNLHGNQPVHVPFMYHILQFLNFHYVLWKICSSSLSDWTKLFQFRTDCDEYSLVLHRVPFLCIIFIVTIITQKETKLQKLAITFHFFCAREILIAEFNLKNEKYSDIEGRVRDAWNLSSNCLCWYGDWNELRKLALSREENNVPKEKISHV